MTLLKAVVRAAIPVGLLDLRHAWRRHRIAKEQEIARAAFHHQRHDRINSVSSRPQHVGINAYDYQAIVAYLVEQGVPEHHIYQGSIPLKSLEFINQIVLSKISPVSPISVLHIGNFVGVSLAFIASKIVELNSRSVVVSIDPNIPHRAIENPQSLVMKLLCTCGLQRHVIPITGFSIDKNLSNDGTVFGEYDPTRLFLDEASCEHVLTNMHLFFKEAFHVACLDGNHDASYLEKEIVSMLPLMKKDGWIIFDDVDTAWVEIQDIFKNVARWGLNSVATDGRVGIARLATKA
jgi:hypothetical protein